MNEAVIKKNLIDLTQSITTIPLSEGQKGGGVYQSDLDRESCTIENSLDVLRLQVKYLLFDLEATRRENRYLRQLLENRPDPRKQPPNFDDFKDNF